MLDFTRRQFSRWVAAAPLLGYILLDDLKGKLLAGKTFKDNIYTRIGVRPFINARGTWTYLSGSLELPEVKAA
jgi:L-seryl-tRNA(Ser) seleniumtransferase